MKVFCIFAVALAAASAIEVDLTSELDRMAATEDRLTIANNLDIVSYKIQTLIVIQVYSVRVAKPAEVWRRMCWTVL